MDFGSKILAGYLQKHRNYATFWKLIAKPKLPTAPSSPCLVCGVMTILINDIVMYHPPPLSMCLSGDNNGRPLRPCSSPHCAAHWLPALGGT